MARQGFGHIVNTASLAGLIGFPTAAPYSAAKHAVVGLSTALRVEAAHFGVKVSVVCPGYVATNFYNAATVLKADRDKLFAGRGPRFMPPQKAARAILRGVRQNRMIIAFPFRARALWWCYRLYPSLLAGLGRKIVADFRAAGKNV